MCQLSLKIYESMIDVGLGPSNTVKSQSQIQIRAVVQCSSAISWEILIFYENILPHYFKSEVFCHLRYTSLSAVIQLPDNI